MKDKITRIWKHLEAGGEGEKWEKVIGSVSHLGLKNKYALSRRTRTCSWRLRTARSKGTGTYFWHPWIGCSTYLHLYITVTYLYESWLSIDSELSEVCEHGRDCDHRPRWNDMDRQLRFQPPKWRVLAWETAINTWSDRTVTTMKCSVNVRLRRFVALLHGEVAPLVWASGSRQRTTSTCRSSTSSPGSGQHFWSIASSCIKTKHQCNVQTAHMTSFLGNRTVLNCGARQRHLACPVSRSHPTWSCLLAASKGQDLLSPTPKCHGRRGLHWRVLLRNVGWLNAQDMCCLQEASGGCHLCQQWWLWRVRLGRYHLPAL